MKIECATEEELNKLKEKAMKVKIIVLEDMNKPPLTNVSNFNKRDKSKVLEKMEFLFTSYTDEQIDKEFNSIVCDKLLDSGIDISQYPIYDLSKKTTLNNEIIEG
jgi:hypothetical protein